MAKGESKFDSSAEKTHKYENKPLPVQDYEFKLLSGPEIKVAQGVGKLPYINAQLELLNTAEKKGGKNRKIYHRFFLNTSPGKDGVKGTNRQDGIVAFAQAIGKKLVCNTEPAVKVDDKGNKENVVILTADSVKQWLGGMAGAMGKLKSKNEKDQRNPDQSWPKVDFFHAAAESSDEDEEEELDEEVEEADEEDEESDEEEADEDEDEDESEEDEDEDSEDEDEDEDEEEEAPKPAKKKVAGKKKKK